MVTQSQSCCGWCRAFCLNREQQIPALRMLHAPFIEMASLPCKRTNGMEGSTLPDGVGSRAPGLGACEGLWGLPLCAVGALEWEAVPIYFGSNGVDGEKCASGSVWDVLELLWPPCGQCASTEVRARLYPCFLLSSSLEAAALHSVIFLEQPLDVRMAAAPCGCAECWRLAGRSPHHSMLLLWKLTVVRFAEVLGCGVSICMCESQVVFWKVVIFH